MTPRQFAAVLDGKQQEERRRTELVRAQTFLICSPHLKKGTTLRRFWPLPWDNEVLPQFPVQTKEEREAWRERAKRIFEQKRQLRQRGNNSAT